MARVSRKDFEGRYFHVMVQGIGKEFVFPDDHCKGYYLTCLQNVKEKCPAKLLAFCVMGNHAHILVCVKNTQELSEYFKQANCLYANYYNRVNQRVGYVFRGRFKSELITDERQLLYCLAYIHNNPLKAGMVKNADDYNYSSFVDYLSGKGIVDFDEAQNFFDINPENIFAIMQERTDSSWLEHDDKLHENISDVFEELKKRFAIKKDSIIDFNTVILIARELQYRCGATLKEMETLLKIGRETLRKGLSRGRVPKQPLG